MEELSLSEKRPRSSYSQRLRPAWPAELLHSGETETRCLDHSRGRWRRGAAGVIPPTSSAASLRLKPRGFEDYVSLGGERAAATPVKLRQEGKKYVVQDGDVMHSSSTCNRQIRPRTSILFRRWAMRALRALPIFVVGVLGKGGSMANIRGLSAANMTPCTPSMDAARRLFQRTLATEAFRQGQKVLVAPCFPAATRSALCPRCWQVVVLSDSWDCSAGSRAGGIAARFPFMKDQVNALIDAGVRGSFLNSTLTPGSSAPCFRARGGHV